MKLYLNVSNYEEKADVKNKLIDLTNNAFSYLDNLNQNERAFVRDARTFFDCVFNDVIDTYVKPDPSAPNNQPLYLRKALYKMLSDDELTSYFETEINYIKKRIKILQAHPEYFCSDIYFVYEHTARFMCIILKSFYNIKAANVINKYEFSTILQNKFNFFNYHEIKSVHNQYLRAFLECSWRVQKSINGLQFLQNHLNKYYPGSENDMDFVDFFKEYGGIDTYAALVFSRLAAEQMGKYLSQVNNKYWENIAEVAKPKLFNDQQKKFFEQDLAHKKVDSRFINNPARNKCLMKIGVFTDLIENEIELLNSRGNNIVHSALSTFYSSCYHNLQLLNYLKKY